MGSVNVNSWSPALLTSSWRVGDPHWWGNKERDNIYLFFKALVFLQRLKVHHLNEDCTKGSFYLLGFFSPWVLCLGCDFLIAYLLQWELWWPDIFMEKNFDVVWNGTEWRSLLAAWLPLQGRHFTVHLSIVSVAKLGKNTVISHQPVNVPTMG